MHMPMPCTRTLKTCAYGILQKLYVGLYDKLCIVGESACLLSQHAVSVVLANPTPFPPWRGPYQYSNTPVAQCICSLTLKCILHHTTRTCIKPRVDNGKTNQV